MKIAIALGMVAALVMGAAVAQTAPAADRYEAAYDDLMGRAASSWVENNGNKLVPRTPTNESELRVAVQKALADLRDPHFKLMTPEDLGALNQIVLAGAVNLGAEVSSVEIIGDQGLEVTSVASNSFGAASGVKQNDRILKINGRSLLGMRSADAKAIWEDARSGPLELTMYFNSSGIIVNVIVQRNPKDGNTGIIYKVKQPINMPIIGAVTPRSSAQEAGLQQGDVIDAIDGIPTRAVSIKTVQNYVLYGGPVGSSFTVTVIRNGSPLQLKVQRRINEGSVTVLTTASREAKVTSQAGDPRYASWIVQFTNLNWRNLPTVLATLDQAVTAANAANLPGAVLDLRGIDGNEPDTAAQIAARFIKKGTVLQYLQGSGSQQVRVAYSVEEGVLTKTTYPSSSGSPVVEVIGKDIRPYEGQLAVVVDGKTSRVAAALAQSMQSNMRARLVGKRTSADGVLTTLVTSDLPEARGLTIQVPSEQLVRIDGSKLVSVVPDFEGDPSSKPFDAFEVINPFPRSPTNWPLWIFSGLFIVTIISLARPLKRIVFGSRS